MVKQESELIFPYDHSSTIMKTNIGISDSNKDLGSSDYVTGLLREHEKMAWMLRAFLK